MMRIAFLIAVHVLGVVAHGPGGVRSGFIALRANAHDGRPKASEGAADCDLACGDDAPKRCVADCNSAILSCISTAKVQHTKETERCRKEILTGIKHVRTMDLSLKQQPNTTLSNNATKQPNNTSANNTAILAADQKVIRNECAAACGDNVNSSCVTSCEMEMYQCIDHTLPKEEAEGKREECFKKVIEKYKGFKEEWNSTHGLVARHDVNTSTSKAVRVNAKNSSNATLHYQVTEADMKMIKDVCNAACTKASGKDGAPSSMCITHCETDMYRCIKETLPDEMDERKQCRKDTEEKYQNWGSGF